MTVLKLANVHVEIGRETLLNDINFEMSEGESIALIGHNGAGKSTLMKTIIGMQQKKEGTIHIHNRDQDIDYLAYKKLFSYIPEEPFLLPELTVMQHVQLYGKSYEMEESSLLTRAEEWLQLFEIEDKMNEYPESLSKGMRQKVQTICALLPDVPLLLIDEPFVGLDVHAITQLEEILIQKIRSGTSILLTTHQLERLDRLATSYVMLKKGLIIEQGDVQQFKGLSRRMEE